MVLSVVALRVALADSGLRTMLGLLAAVLGLALVVGPGAIGGPLGGLVPPWPLLSCVVPLALVSSLYAPMRALERTSARGPHVPGLMRLGTAGAVIAVATLVVALAAPSDGAPVAGDGVVAWRNAALVSGLALLGGAWLSAAHAWIPSTAYVLACVAAGVPDGGEPYGWTVLLQPAEDAAPVAIAAVVFVTGLAAAAWSLRRPRLGSRRRR